ncbi:uncharacterized protein LOC132718680 [Ruditapes philippinarum]|uniref:uncharacterized protein LOC132718680 n=1 Tax=Ruditapes philippinarum TaxID=129788 RepID=UPI00295B7D19|nr:uncharacterized protein LOC132718680 [Ruditapes philippinarum]
MANKEPKIVKRFPKRLLSSFRKGKKLNLPAGKNEPLVDSDERTGFTSYDIENAQNENATINLEASIVLTTPRKQKYSERGNISALVTPKRNLRSVLHTDSNDVANNLSPPAVERLVLGGPMSASADSGIDCSILLSERNSPEQFVAFTRREAERLRQEQLHNASVLETLNETDRSSGDDCDTDNLNSGAGVAIGTGKENEANNEQLIGAEGGLSLDETLCKVGYSSSKIACDTLPPPPPCIGASACEQTDTLTSDYIQENSDNLSGGNLNNLGGDYVMLAENSYTEASPIVDVTGIISENMRRTKETEKSESVSRNIGINYSLSSPCDTIEMEETPESVVSSENVTTDQQSINTDKSYLHYYANRTDEIKSAEARFRNEQSAGTSIHLSVSHDIINPVPIVTPSVATHRVLQSTPSPARLYVNENSAFAKCKSLKRSVSDVGKGILGRFRHRSKDSRAQKECDNTVENTKEKKLHGKKAKQTSRKRHNSEKSLKVTTSSVSYSQIKFKKKQSLKSPVTKEILPTGGKTSNEAGGDLGNPKQSPVFKEILSHSVKEELEASFNRQSFPLETESKFKQRCSPVVMESIEDMTSSISKMTSALCASSAESIACICDCKNRFSDPECCEKRKTPSPHGSLECNDQRKTPPLEGSEHFENTKSDCKAAVNVVDEKETLNSYTCPTLENEITEYSPLIDRGNAQKNKGENLPEASALFCNDTDDTSDDSCDECYSDNSDDDDGECSDLDCSNCCNVSPNTGNVNLLSSSSSGSECSLIDSCENLAMNGRMNKSKKLENSGSGSSQSSSSSFMSNAGSSNSSGNSSPSIEEYSFNMENSSFSVSFKEIDFENGDVMYIENNIGDDFEERQLPESDDSFKLSSVCATPVSSPRVYMDESLENSPCIINPDIINSCQNTNYRNKHPEDHSPKLIQKSIPANCVKENNEDLTSSPSLSVETSPTPLNLSQSSSFTNVSFEGSFADVSFSVHNQSSRQRSKKSSEKTVHENSFINDQSKIDNDKCEKFDYSLSESFNRLNDSMGGQGSRYKSRPVRRGYNTSLSSLNDSRLLQNTLRRNHNRMNDSCVLNDSLSFNHNTSVGSLNRNVRRRQNLYRHSLNSSNLSTSQINESFDRFNTSRVSYLEPSESPMTSPLDLSINRGKATSLDRSMTKKSDKHWVDRHVGQVFSPAKRVLHKNSGLSESDLCKQILDLYVSDADESGFNIPDIDVSLNESHSHNVSQDHGNGSARVDSFASTNLDDSSSDEDRPGLHYGTYVAPRNVVKETNVDDFTTTTVWTCYTGEAKTRKLQDKSGSAHLRGEDRRKAALNELHNMSMEKTSKNRSVDESPTKHGKVRGREALQDQTNTKRRLSTLDMPPSLSDSITAEGVQQDIRENSRKAMKMNDKSFDHLTLLHTAQNGQRRVRCLTMDESQSVVKYYPPPKEASRISWGQTISEMDLYRHTPRKTPVKTRPILNQKENTYPYEDDTPSPIVLTKMRKPKSLAKKYKNWPWS